MGILDNLIEKRDLMQYINGRKLEINKIRQESLNNSPDEYKEQVNQKFDGRIAELDALYSVIINNMLSEESCKYWYLTDDND